MSEIAPLQISTIPRTARSRPPIVTLRLGLSPPKLQIASAIPFATKPLAADTTLRSASLNSTVSSRLHSVLRMFAILSLCFDRDQPLPEARHTWSSA